VYNIRVITLLDIYIIHGLVTSGPQRRALAALEKREEKYVLFTLQNRHAPCPLEIRMHAKCNAPHPAVHPMVNKVLSRSTIRSWWPAGPNYGHSGSTLGLEFV
jgi:hypothetical protein